jgi:WD40-like Beta Propeller Repeat
MASLVSRAAAMALLLMACHPARPPFDCAREDATCGDVAGATCVNGRCAVPSEDCDSHLVYADNAGEELAGTCVLPPPTRIFHVTSPPDASVQTLYASDVRDGQVGPEVPLVGAASLPTRTIRNVQFAKGGDVVVFSMDAHREGAQELYVVRFGPEGPSEPVRISGEHAEGTAVTGAFLAKDGHAALYAWGDPDDLRGAGEYYFADLTQETPGIPLPLAGAPPAREGTLSADGSKFAFVDESGAQLVAVAGSVPSVPVKASGNDKNVTGLVLSPTATRIAYVANTSATDQVNELFVADVSSATPSPPQKASGSLVPGGDVATGLLGFAVHAFSPDGKKLAYLADATTNDVLELYVTDVSGPVPSATQKVNGVLVSGGNVGDAIGISAPETFAFSPQSHWIAYRADQRTDGVQELYLVDVTGVAPAPAQVLNGPLVPGQGVGTFGFTSDESGIAYVANQRDAKVAELFYVNLRGDLPSVSQLVGGDSTAGRAIALSSKGYLFHTSPDATRVAFAASKQSTGPTEVFLSDISTGTPAQAERVQQSSTAMSLVLDLAWSADSRSLVYTSNLVDANFDIWFEDARRPLARSPTKVNAAPAKPFLVLLAP